MPHDHPKSSPKRPAQRGGAATDRANRWIPLLLPGTTFLVLGYEIALTRLFAYVFTYHLTALAVSFAMFGLGAGAYLRVRWLAAYPQRPLAILAHLGTAAALLALYAVLLMTHDAVILIILSAVPFVGAGISISYYYAARRSARVAVTYALDMAGAAAACVLGVLLLVAVGADGVLLWLAVLSSVTAMVSMIGVASPRRGLWLALAALGVIVPVTARVFRTQWPDPLLNRHSHADKQLPRELLTHGAVVDTAWSAVGRADLYETPEDPDKVILTDAMNATIFLNASPEGLQDLFAALPYALAPARRVLIIGAGAGLEARIAHDAGAAEVDAVELNDAIIRLVRRWRAFGGPVYDQPGVTLFVEEGRKFVLTRSQRYDVIQMSLVLTATAQSGTYALAEGYLYTQEAFQSYFQHLEPGGTLVLIDDSFERTLKNTVTAVRVMEQAFGWRSPEAMQRVAVVYDPSAKKTAYKYQLLVSPTPFPPERIRRLAAEAARRHLQFLWLPGLAAAPEYQSLSATGAAAFVQAAALNYEPPTDDKPFFNNFAKTRADYLAIARPFLILAALALASWAACIAFAQLKVGASRSPTVLAGLYGAGFMFLELGLLHKLTLAAGGPTQVLSVLLFALLLSCGLGALVSGRVTARLRLRGGSWALLVAVVGVITAAAVERWYRLEGVASPAWRIVCVVALVTPVGLCLGAPFPDLLRRHGQSDERQVAYLWAVNGVGAVCGGALTLVLLPVIGGRALLFIGTGIYLSAWVADRLAGGKTTLRGKG